MALYTTVAPELSEFVSENAAKNFAENLLTHTPPTYRTLSDLDSNERLDLFTWLKWFGQNRKPTDASPWIMWSPNKVATELGMSKSYVLSLVAERNAIVSEVAQWGDSAFDIHIAPVITNLVLGGETVLDGYEDVLEGYTDVLNGYTEVLDGYVDELVDGYVVSVPSYVSVPNYVSTPQYVSNPVYVFVPDGNFTITGTTFLSYSAQETYVSFTRNTTTVNKTKTQIEANGGSVSDTEIFVAAGTLPVVLRADDEVVVHANEFESTSYIIS